MTLAEVLVSMGILVIGLLGVAALFPVGGHYMLTGDVADQAGAIAQAALDDAIVRGHLDPENWVVHSIAGPAIRFAYLVSGDGFPETPNRGLREALTDTPANRSTSYGDAFVIDPLGLAAGIREVPGNGPVVIPALGAPMRSFPAQNPVARNPVLWGPWSGQFSWPVRRVTTVHDVTSAESSLNIAGAPPPAFVWADAPAEEAFTANDDLALILPENGDDPSRGRWATWTDGSTPWLPSTRRPRGDYSWLISVSPGSSVARDALATSPDAYPYDVSVVVFHKRVLGAGATAEGGVFGGLLEAERLVNAKVVSTSTAGGELLLERRMNPSQDPVVESPFEDLREGEYVMLTGPHPLSTAERPMLFLQWYRVLTIEDSGDEDLDGDSNTSELLDGDGPDARVLVSLRGPDWPWRPAAESGGDLEDANLENDLRVAIIPGAVAVHTKTMRLESGTPWSID